MTPPATLEDFPHIAQAHAEASIRLEPQKDSGVVMRTVALSLAALIAPVLAGTLLARRAQPVLRNRSARFEVAASAASTTIR